MACKQVIVLPPEIPMIFGSPHIQTFIGEMVPAMLEVVAADPLSTRYEVDVEYILHAFIKFMMAPFNAKNARSRWDPHSRWERYDRNRATLVNLPKKPLLPGAARVPSRTKLIVLYLPPTNSAPLSTISQ